MRFSLFIPFRLVLVIISVLPFTGRSQETKEILMRKVLDLDTSLTNYASPWKPKIPATISKMPKIRAGSFRILFSEKTRPERGKKSSSKGLFTKTSTVTNFRDAELLVLYAQTDTISVKLKFETTRTNKESTGFSEMIFRNEKSETNLSYECLGMRIYLPGDSSPWQLHFLTSDTLQGDSTDYYGNLVRGDDTIQVQYAKGFKGHEKIWKGYPTGLIFTRHERQLAAFQFGYKKYIWISSREEKRTQQLLGSFILVYLSMTGQ
jgi:hypothetical protein